MPRCPRRAPAGPTRTAGQTRSPDRSDSDRGRATALPPPRCHGLPREQPIPHTHADARHTRAATSAVVIPPGRPAGFRVCVGGEAPPSAAGTPAHPSGPNPSRPGPPVRAGPGPPGGSPGAAGAGAGPRHPVGVAEVAGLGVRPGTPREARLLHHGDHLPGRAVRRVGSRGSPRYAITGSGFRVWGLGGFRV